jgi:hypothetical protein
MGDGNTQQDVQQRVKPILDKVRRGRPAGVAKSHRTSRTRIIPRFHHGLKFKISPILIEGHDIQRSPCVSAHRVAVISAAWLRTSWGGTRRASLISSVVGDNKSFSM